MGHWAVVFSGGGAGRQGQAGTWRLSRHTLLFGAFITVHTFAVFLELKFFWGEGRISHNVHKFSYGQTTF